MISYPSMAESLEKELDRYEKEQDQKPLEMQETHLRPAFIQVFPEQARGEIKAKIEETERLLAESAASLVLREISFDRSLGENSPGPRFVPRRRPPTPEGLVQLARYVQSLINHYSGANMGSDLLRKLLQDLFEAVSRSDEVAESENYLKLEQSVCDAVLKHWQTDKSFFDRMLRPTAKHGVDSYFWSNFRRRGFLLRRLKLAEDQPKEAKNTEPHLIAVLSLLGHRPPYFFEANPDTQQIWITEARKRLRELPENRTRFSPAALTESLTDRKKLAWFGSPVQLADFFRFVFDPGADQEAAEHYFRAKGSRDTIIPGSAAPLKTRMPTNHLRYAFYVAQDEMHWLDMQHPNAELARFCLDRNGRELNPKRLGKNKVTTDLSKRHQKDIHAKLLEIKALAK